MQQTILTLRTRQHASDQHASLDTHKHNNNTHTKGETKENIQTPTHTNPTLTLIVEAREHRRKDA
jgi:hypothetical protein